MTSGALIQIVAKGWQDLYLTCDDEMTYFKSVYHRHTNFSMETIEEQFQNGAGFGTQCRCKLPANGDLITNITLYAHMESLNPEFYEIVEKSHGVLHSAYNCACHKCIQEQYQSKLNYGWVNSLGHALIKSVWIEIGGTKIDKQYGEWLEIWSELTLTAEKLEGYNEMIGRVDTASFRATTFTGSMELYVPLQFWFCRNIGSALPILNLYYHDVELVIEFRNFNELWVSNQKGVASPCIPNFQSYLLVEYVYLDIFERKTFYEGCQVYLIEQLQTSGENPVTSNNVGLNLYFNHPVKELIWVLKRRDVSGKADGLWPNTNYPMGNDHFNYTSFQSSTHIKEDTFKSGYLQFNSIDRSRARKASYYRLYHPYYHHTRIPSKNIYVYSFGFHPERHNPSGQMNYSRVENARLILQFKDNRAYTDYILNVYGTNYNVFVVMGGLGSLLFYS